MAKESLYKHLIVHYNRQIKGGLEMRIAIYQICDIHIKISSRLIPADRVAATFQAIPDHIEAIFLVFSGDIAFSGISSEYKIAEGYIRDLILELNKLTKASIFTLFVPGNHDCDFTKDQSLRDLVLNQVIQNPIEPPKLGLLPPCLETQRDFFNFSSKFGSPISENSLERLIGVKEIKLKEKKISFIQVNSAWLSKLKEEQGTLIFPTWFFPEKVEGDFVIGCMHHPYPWFKSSSGRDARRVFDSQVDLVLTGHEHETEGYSKRTSKGDEISYLEGAVFGDPHSKNSCSFNIIEVDLETFAYTIHNCDWASTFFKVSTYALNETEALFYRRKRKRSNFILKSEFYEELNHPGIPLFHPKKTVEFNDIFIVPNLRTLALKGNQQAVKNEFIASDNVINRILLEKRVLISGSDFAGRTSLAKFLFSQLESKHKIPVLVTGTALKNSDPKHFKNVIEKCITAQYDDPDLAEYWQKPMDDKILILDDFQDANLNNQGKAVFGEWVIGKFGFVFLFSKNRAQIEEAILDTSNKYTWGQYKHFNIAPFSSHQKDLLIEKWHQIGDSLSTSTQDLAHSKEVSSRLVNTILGRNLLPSRPVFVLLILQEHESSKKAPSDSGTLGYYYEVLVRTAMEESNGPGQDFDTKVAFLEELSWHYFELNKIEISHEAFERFLEGHWQKFRLIGSSGKILQDLIEKRLICKSAVGYFFFQRYIYYYFLARYMRSHWSEERVRISFSSVALNVHEEKNAKIVIFLTYLSRDKTVIDIVVENAKKLFQEFEPFKIESDFNFLERFALPEPTICLPDNDPLENRKRILKSLELAESSKDDFQQGPEEEPDFIRGPESEDVDIKNLLLIAKANRSVQILGQILRNFAGFLDGDVKCQLAKEAFSLGLRSLKVFFSIVEKHFSGIVDYFSEVFGKNLKDMPRSKKEEFAQHLIYFVSEIKCLDTIKNISSAVASESLVPTYEDVERSYNLLSAEFIQTVIRLDHFKSFPEDKVMELSKKVQKSQMGKTLLQMLVTQHFYLFPRDHTIRQRVCDKLKIRLEKGRLPLHE